MRVDNLVRSKDNKQWICKKCECRNDFLHTKIIDCSYKNIVKIMCKSCLSKFFYNREEIYGIDITTRKTGEL